MQLHEDARRALRESELVIRQLTRDRGYWVAADELSNMWFGNSFRPDPLVQRAVTINLACAIDTLYEGARRKDSILIAFDLSETSFRWNPMHRQRR